MEEQTVWDFVEKYYPDYYHSDDIALADDYSKLINHEINGDAEQMLIDDYDGDINNPQIVIDSDQHLVNIYYEAIEEFLSKNKI